LGRKKFHGRSDPSGRDDRGRGNARSLLGVHGLLLRVQLVTTFTLGVAESGLPWWQGTRTARVAAVPDEAD
jgi:hypothetical protein